MVHDLNNLSPIAIDCMKELGNIGSSSAANSLSAMLEKPVKMRVPDVRVLEYQQVIDELGGAEKIITGILVPLHGDIKGMMMFLLQESFANVVLNTFLQRNEVKFHALDETERSTILEIGNIMAGSYLNALSELTGLSMKMAVPSMNVDMLGAILNVMLVEFAEVGDTVLFIDDGFIIDNVDIKSNIILIPEMESLDTLMKKLGVY